METVEIAAPAKSQYNVLLVDDCPDIIQIVRLYINDPRIRLTVCTNGLEAVQAFKQATFDLVLMDIQMPVLDGCAATLAIRHWEVQHKKTPTPISALTASCTASDLAKIFKAGCTNYLPKPITKPILLQTVNQFFGPRAKAQAVGEAPDSQLEAALALSFSIDDR